MVPTTAPGTPATCRPRVEGDREVEILDAAVDLLLEVGYERLTMDAVAAQARAGKATLYRRWGTKAGLVVDALNRSGRCPHLEAPDTGSLRGDLIALMCGGAGGDRTVNVFAVVLTALQTDPEFGDELRRRFLPTRFAVMQEVYRRAAERGELCPTVDVGLLGPALPGIVMHRSILLGEPVTPELVTRVVDQIILPAATGHRTASDSPSTHSAPTPTDHSNDERH